MRRDGEYRVVESAYVVRNQFPFAGPRQVICKLCSGCVHAEYHRRETLHCSHLQVPGDRVSLRSGSAIPADCKLQRGAQIQASRIHIHLFVAPLLFVPTARGEFVALTSAFSATCWVFSLSLCRWTRLCSPGRVFLSP